jgi:hypothetical protein
MAAGQNSWLVFFGGFQIQATSLFKLFYLSIARTARAKNLKILCLKLEFSRRAKPGANLPRHEALDRRERVLMHKLWEVALLKAETCFDVMKPVDDD